MRKVKLLSTCREITSGTYIPSQLYHETLENEKKHVHNSCVSVQLSTSKRQNIVLIGSCQ